MFYAYLVCSGQSLARRHCDATQDVFWGRLPCWIGITPAWSSQYPTPFSPQMDDGDAVWLRCVSLWRQYLREDE